MIKKIKSIFGTDYSKIIYEEIWSYFEFHKNINKYFNEGVNLEPYEYEQEIYFVDYNWIRKWKKYTNYENVITMDKNYDFLKENGFLEYSKNHNLKGIDSGTSYISFPKKAVYKIEDFDCLIDYNTYKYFKKYKDTFNYYLGYFDGNLKSIKCLFLKDILALLIPYNYSIKIIFKQNIQASFEQFQFNLYFKNYRHLNINNDNKYDIDYFYLFKEKCLKNEKKRDELIKLFINKHISGEKQFDIKEYECSVQNMILFKNEFNKHDNKDKNLELVLNAQNIPRLVGLKNLGGTSYMNAAFQCFINLNHFTNYLLNKNNFLYILQKNNNCEVIGTYCQLLQKLCCDQNDINYYTPNEFKNILSLKNPLFEGIKESNPSDLISFLIRQMNLELNKINLSLYNDLSNQYNNNSELINFIEEYSSENNNIISKLFSSIIENESLCSICNTRKYDYEMIFTLEIPLKGIYNKIYAQQIEGEKKLNLVECISNLNEKNYFTGENALYCSVCQKKINSTCFKRIHSLSPYLILILKWGTDNNFQCNFDFPKEINLHQYILNPQINYDYNLIGVIALSNANNNNEHFIAYCKHRILNEWYSYNDEIVTKLNDKINGYKNGIPYVLFYESKQGDKNILFDLKVNNNIDMNVNNNSNNINNMMLGNNQIQNLQINNMPINNNMDLAFYNNMKQNFINNNISNFDNNMNNYQNQMNNNINGLNNNNQLFNNNFN